jgi:hypothetical protein
MMTDVQERYNTDPVFRRAVDMLHEIIRSAEVSPAQIRQAARLAGIHYEMYRTRRWEIEFTHTTRGLTADQVQALLNHTLPRMPR